LLGSVLQLALVGWLTLVYVNVRNAGAGELFLFEQRFSWFSAFNIQYYVGVDGISVAMMLMTALVVVAGVLVSWKVERMTKEFFFLLLFLSAGAYGFFMSLDLFTMFFFLELAVIPKFLLIAIWGSGRKEYSANKLALMLMGGSALVFVGFARAYSGGGADEIFSALVFGLRGVWRFVSVSYLGARWTLECAHCRFDVSRRYFYEAGRLWLPARGHLPDARRRA
jgi:NADH-quinone oxidoreductase subunit M